MVAKLRAKHGEGEVESIEGADRIPKATFEPVWKPIGWVMTC